MIKIGDVLKLKEELLDEKSVNAYRKYLEEIKGTYVKVTSFSYDDVDCIVVDGNASFYIMNKHIERIVDPEIEPEHFL